MVYHFVVLIQSAIHTSVCHCRESTQKHPCAEQPVLRCRPGQMPAATSFLPWKRLTCSPACLKLTRSCTACGSCTVSCPRSVGLRHRQPTACPPGLLHRYSLTSARYAMRECQCQQVQKILLYDAGGGKSCVLADVPVVYAKAGASMQQEGQSTSTCLQCSKACH